MRLTVLGAGPAYTDRPGATGASYLVSLGDTHVLLDLGQGSLPRLFAAIPPTSLAAVVISHLHPDHFIDLVALRHYLRWEFDPPRRIRVLGPAGLADRLDALHADPRFAAQSFDTETLGTGGARDRRAAGARDARPPHRRELRHPRRAGVGRAGLVYSGDCGRAPDLAPLIEPGDTLLSEVSFGPGPVVKGVPHLDGPAVGALAATSGAGQVLLTHDPDGLRPRRDGALVRGAVRRPGDVRVARIRRGAAGWLTRRGPGAAAAPGPGLDRGQRPASGVAPGMRPSARNVTDRVASAATRKSTPEPPCRPVSASRVSVAGGVSCGRPMPPCTASTVAPSGVASGAGLTKYGS